MLTKKHHNVRYINQQQSEPSGLDATRDTAKNTTRAAHLRACEGDLVTWLHAAYARHGLTAKTVGEARQDPQQFERLVWAVTAWLGSFAPGLGKDEALARVSNILLGCWSRHADFANLPLSDATRLMVQECSRLEENDQH